MLDHASLEFSARPRRSVLYIPGSKPRALEKAKSLPADCVVFDLEDGVAPDDKITARGSVCEAIEGGGYNGREVVVRINGLETQWGIDDVLALSRVSPDAILLPKVNGASDVEKLFRQVLNDMPKNIDLWAMLETPLGILNASQIAASSQTTPLKALVFGSNDLIKDMAARFTSERVALQTAMSVCVLAARAYGLAVLDGVYNDFNDEAGLVRECEQGIDFGFDGKTLIHPAQLGAANHIFAPSPKVLAQASAIIAAFESPANAGSAVLTVNGKMTEILHYEQSKRLLDLAAQIEALESSASGN